MNKVACGIYIVENIINGKKYVGQSINVEKRMKGYHQNSIVLNNAIKKYGEENFHRYIFFYCEKDQLGFWEKMCIEILDSHVTRWGYNISYGGNTPFLDRHHSNESKKKMSIKLKGRIASNETKIKMSNAQRGKSKSKEHKKKISDTLTGRVSSPETKTKLSIYRTGRRLSANTRKKMSESHKKRKHSVGKKLKNVSSLYHGVSNDKNRKKPWRFALWINGKTLHLGDYYLEIDAAKAYDKYVIENNLQRPLNFPS